MIWWIVAFVWIIAMPGHVNRGSAALAGVLVLVPAWLALLRLHQAAPYWLLFLLLLVVAADVGAYFAGRQFGRHKLAPKVSPGKTWEGVVGGIVGGCGDGGCRQRRVFKVEMAPFIAVCAVVVVASIVGDLTESMFKRHAGLKDSGTFFPATAASWIASTASRPRHRFFCSEWNDWDCVNERVRSALRYSAPQAASASARLM